MRSQSIIVLLLWLISVAAHASSAIQHWGMLDPPVRNSARWYCENQAEYSWKVSAVSGELAVERISTEQLFRSYNESINKYPQFSVGEYASFPRSVIKVSNGYIVGYNKGEWGGATYWFSKDASKSYEISKDLIEEFIEKNGRIFATESSLESGYFIEFGRDNGRWKIINRTDLHSQPGRYISDGKNSLLVIAGNNILKVYLSGIIRVIHTSDSWYGNSNSLAKTHNGDLYIGAGDAVIQLKKTPLGYVEKWFMREQDIGVCPCRYVKARNNCGEEYEVIRCEK